jgi:hypothetical protein
MPELKPITRDGVSAALQKAERYRLLNDSWSAESICLDVLEVAPDDQHALVTLLLAATDQFADGLADGVARARAVLPRLRDEYKRHYYAGIIAERRALAELRRGMVGAESSAYQWLVEAMDHFARAEAMRPAGNDEAILRWNTCVRIMQRNERIRAEPVQEYEPALE